MNTFLEIQLLINTEAKIAIKAKFIKIGLSPERIDLTQKIRHGSNRLIVLYQYQPSNYFKMSMPTHGGV
jgi:hypothetical protein